MSQKLYPLGDDPGELLARLLSCGSYQAIERAMLVPLAHALGATSGVFVQFLGLPLEGDTIGQCRHIGVGRRAIDEYGEGLYSVDPMVQPALQWLRSAADPPGAVIRLLSEIEDWRDQPLYRRFLERFDIAHVLAAAIPVRTALGPQCVCFGFHRGRRQQPFAPVDLERLRHYLPALQPVVLSLVHAEVAAHCRTLLDTVAPMGGATGFLVLDGDLRVRHATVSALRRLGLDTGDVRSGASRNHTLGELRRRVLQHAHSEQSPAATSASPPGEEGGAARDFRVRPVDWLDGSAAFLVTFPQTGAEDGFTTACCEFGLSGREREVARLVCRGLASVDVASHLGLAPRTVENHLRSIYAKVNVRSRAQLIAQLLRLN